MESVYVWLAVLGFNVAFAIFLFLLNRSIEQYPQKCSLTIRRSYCRCTSPWRSS